MKTSLRCAALAIALGGSAWLGTSPPRADAAPLVSCEYLRGKLCSPVPSTRACTWKATGEPGVCGCETGTWDC